MKLIYGKVFDLQVSFKEIYKLTYLSTDIQHKCSMLAVEKYTSKLFQTSHINGPNNHLKHEKYIYFI